MQMNWFFVASNNPIWAPKIDGCFLQAIISPSVNGLSSIPQEEISLWKSTDKMDSIIKCLIAICYIWYYIYIYNPMKSLCTLLKTNCWPCRQKTCYKVSYQIHHIHIFPSNFWLELVMYIMKYHELSWNIPIHTPIKT